jgi:serine/threonine protein kinase
VHGEQGAWPISSDMRERLAQRSSLELLSLWPVRGCGLRKLGKYELLGELGRGAFGIVYRARDPIINRMVALKTITTGVADNPHLLERFYREAQSAGSLQHPNIVTVYDMGDEGGTPFIAMEFVDGHNLGDLIAKRSALPVALKLAYGVQACRAFDYAHKRGIIHRDIKPGNVMVNREGTVKVVDFGIARVLETSKTQTGTLIGTFAYMAPEVFDGVHACERTDIWSFGVLLYELLAYQGPFSGESAPDLMQNICRQEPLPLRQVAPDCPGDLESVVHRILRKSGAERFQTMEHLLLELDPICRRLQAETVTKILEQSRLLVERGEFEQARDLLGQAFQIENSIGTKGDFTTTQARALLEKVNAELKRLSVRPKAQQHVERGRALLQEGKHQEASAEADKALRLDSQLEPALELVREVQREIECVQLVNECLQSAKQLLVEGLPNEAEALLLKAQEIDPSNAQLPALQQQVLEEKERRLRRVQLLEGMEQARVLWNRQKYQECIDVLTRLQQAFPGEDEIVRLLENAREDQAEQTKQEKLAEARNLLPARRYEECIAVLMKLQQEFPREEEIQRLLETAREDQAEQNKRQKLAEARNLLAAHGYEECIAVLAKLQEEFAGDNEIRRLLEIARQDQVEQNKREKLAEARKLLSARRHEECISLLAQLQRDLADDEEIGRLLNNAREDQAVQDRKQKLAAARDLFAAQRFADALLVLDLLLAADPKDSAVIKLRTLVLREQQKQVKSETLQREWEMLKKLASQRAYPEVVARAESLLREFPGDADLMRLVEFARNQQAQMENDLRLRAARDRVQGFLQANHFSEAAAAAQAALESFPGNADFTTLLEQAQTRQRKEMVRQQIERRIREIKVKINRGQLSDAKELARETLTTLGPVTDVRQLLSSAEAEYDAREKKTRQEQRLETVRTFVQSGRLGEAATTLDEIIKSGDFDALDPRLYQAADEIAVAREAAAAPTGSIVASEAESPAREYVVIEGPPFPTVNVSGAGSQPAIQPAAVVHGVAPAPPEAAPVAPPAAAPANAGSRAELTPVAVDRAARLLARHIGPISGVLAKRAAQRADSLRTLYLLLAEDVESKTERARFLRDAGFLDS